MEINISEITLTEREHLDIYCHRVDENIQDIVHFVKSRQGQLTGTIDGTQYEVPIAEIYYIEAVDERVFFYTQSDVYETRSKLYELEEALADKHFLRVSKSVLLNLMKVASIRPSLNGRFTAVLQIGEQIIISRKYVPALKKALKGGS